MLTAINEQGEKLSSLQNDRVILKKLSKEKKLYCPYCQANLVFHAGEKRIFHFKHHYTNCIYETETETTEHLMGKVTIYNWLKRLIEDKYPGAIVEMEYRIKETNQIADIYFETKSHIRFVIEIQCSVIQIEEWERRRSLYRKAGIKDIWIFGTKNHIRYDDESGNIKFNALQSEMNNKERNVYFWDAENVKLYHTGQLITSVTDISYIQLDFNNGLSFIPVQSPCRFIIGNQDSKSVIDSYLKKRGILANEKWEERRLTIKKREEKKAELSRTKDYLKGNLGYIENFSFEKLMVEMIEQERLMFKHLINKYKFTEDNFPAIFVVKLKEGDAIKTPSPLWQLLVFDQAITCNSNPNDLIFAKYFFQKVKNLIRFDSAKDAAIIIYDYFLLLERMGFIQKQTITRKYIHPFIIKFKDIPIINDREINKKVAFYYTLSQINNFEKFYEDLYFQYTLEDLKAALKVYWQNHVKNEKKEVPEIISKLEEQKLWDRIYIKGLETNRRLGVYDDSLEPPLKEETIVKNYGYLKDITITNINHIFKELNEVRRTTNTYKELEDLTKIKNVIQQQGDNQISEEQKMRYYEICNKYKYLLDLE